MGELAGLVILFNPDNKLGERIKSYLPHLSKLYIIDNSEHQTFELSWPDASKCIYIHDGSNQGIAKRLNDAVNLALEDGYTWLLTMDQDSAFEGDSLVSYIKCINSYPNKSRVAMFGVEFESSAEASETCKPFSVPQLITSGSVVNIAVCSQIGGFDEALFIDEVDLEYCYRAFTNNFDIIKFGNIFLQHSLGNLAKGMSLKSFRYTTRTLHSPVRIYYMVRNYLYVRAKYRGIFVENDKIRRKALFNRLKNNLLYNKQRHHVIYYFFKGVKDYYGRRMGKIGSVIE